MVCGCLVSRSGSDQYGRMCWQGRRCAWNWGSTYDDLYGYDRVIGMSIERRPGSAVDLGRFATYHIYHVYGIAYGPMGSGPLGKKKWKRDGAEEGEEEEEEWEAETGMEQALSMLTTRTECRRLTFDVY